MENIAIGEAAPSTVNSSVRTRIYLTEAEIERLMAAARKSSRYGHRDATLLCSLSPSPKCKVDQRGAYI